MQCFPAEAVLHSHPSEWAWANRWRPSEEALLGRTWGETARETWEERHHSLSLLNDYGSRFTLTSSSTFILASQQVLPLVHSLIHLLQMASWRLNWQMTRENTAPVQMPIVFKFFCSVPSFNIFYHVSLEELPQKLQSLVPGHLRTKVVVASQEVVEVIHRLRSREAPVVAAEVCPVPPERHASSEKFNGFIPLRSRETRTDWQLGLSQSVCDTSFFPWTPSTTSINKKRNTFLICTFWKCLCKMFKCVSQETQLAHSKPVKNEECH